MTFFFLLMGGQKSLPFRMNFRVEYLLKQEMDLPFSCLSFQLSQSKCLPTNRVGGVEFWLHTVFGALRRRMRIRGAN